jgi:ABC transport system ATP-binding/permease protein
MAPPILYLEAINLTFGGAPLLQDAAVTVHRNDRICVVGRNGSGKSTFLKIAAGLVEPDQGRRFVQPGVTLRYLPQEPDFAGYATIREYVETGLAPGDDVNRVYYLLDRLGLTGEENPSTISGGEARRAALARTLSPSPDILLLDEPTNHLDLPVIEWLEKELGALGSALVIISHDRRFLSNLSKRTLWIDRGITRMLEQGFAAFEDWRDTLLEEEQSERHKLDRRIVREEHWITHGVSGRRKRNMRRVDALTQLRRQRTAGLLPPGEVQLTQAQAARSGKLVTEITNISKAYGDQIVVRDFSTIIHRGDRIGVVGPNGAGKTTLVKLITGALPPDRGKIRLGVNLEMLVVDQNREALKPDWTLKEALTGGSGDMVDFGESKKHVIGYMKDFLFTPEQAGTPVSALSGGERARLLLARGLAHPSNLLVLDEPTNDLDLETLDLLQEFIAGYDGTVILVSHDRDFLDRICTSIIASDGGGIWQEYAGGYDDMVAQKGSGVAQRKSVSRSQPRRENRTSTSRRDSNKPKPARLSFKHKHALEKLPEEIAELEKKITKIKSELARPDLYTTDPRRFQQLVDALAEHEARLARKEEEWLELEILREEIGNEQSD